MTVRAHRAARIGARLGAALAMVLAPLAAGAQPAASQRVGVLVPNVWDEQTFRHTLSERGYREGANLVVDVRSAQGALARLPSLASELVAASPDVIVAVNTPGTQAAMAATRTIPIVMVEVGDPVATGFVSSLARPEGNVTGVSNLCGELGAKRLSLLKEALPSARRVAVMLNPDDPITAPQVKDVQRAAPTLGLEVRFFPVRAPAELTAVLDAMAAWQPGGVLWLCGQQAELERRTSPLALRRRLPAMPYQGDAVPTGALLSYAPSRADSMRRAALYVERILKGARPTELPVEQPLKFDLVVNQRTARALGLTLPPALLLRADRVIE